MGPGGGRGGAEAESLRPLLGFGRRFMRNRALSASGWLMAAVVTVVVALYIVLSSLSLSGEQVVERDLGRFQFEADVLNAFPVTPRNAGRLPELERAARAGGAADAVTTFTSPDVRPALPNAPYTSYTETDWSRNPVPRRYVLLDGRWPERPGEVVLTRTSDGALAAPGERLAVLAGHERFRVVGLADDRYGDSHEILAAPGTFRTIGAAALRAFPDIAAYARLLWDGGSRDGVVDALSARLARASGLPRDEVARLIFESTTDRAGTENEENYWLKHFPSAYAVPSLFLPVLAVLAAFGFGQRRLRRSGDLLVATGVRPGAAALALAAATAGWLAVALAGGVALGGALGIIGRVVLERFGQPTQDLSPIPLMVDPAVRLGSSSAVACVVCTAVLGRVLASGRREREPSAGAPGRRVSALRRRATALRRGAVALAACVAIVQASELRNAVDAMALAATVAVLVLLLTPEVLGAALRALPRTDPRLRLVRQHLAYDRARGAIAVAVLAAVLGLPLGYLTLLDGVIQNAGINRPSRLAPGHVVVSDGASDLPPPSPVLAVVRRRLGSAQPPVQVRRLGASEEFVDVRGSEYNGLLDAVDTEGDAARFLARPLTPPERAMLSRGGLLVWDGLEGASRVIVSSGRARPREVRLPAVAARVRSGMQGRGVMLTATARRHGLPISDGVVLFTGVSDVDAQAARQAVVDAGLDPRQVTIYEPPVLHVPDALRVTAVSMLLVVLLCSIAVARGQVRTMRSYMGMLVAIRITPGWARQVLLVQSAFLTVVGTLVAFVMALPPILLLAWRAPRLELSVPWGQLGTAIGAFYVAVLLASALSARRIRASDRAAL